MAANTGRLGNVAIKKETTWGTYVAPDFPLRVSSESLVRNIEHVEDPALIGEVFTTDLCKVGDGANGGLEAAAHPEEIGPLLYWTLGADAVGDPNAAYVVCWYTGSDDYASLEKTGNDITAKTGATQAAAVADNNFGTLGVVDVTGASFDTAAELASQIEGFTGWSAKALGLGTASSANIADFSQTALYDGDVYQQSVILAYPESGSTTAKTHTVTPAALSANLPSYTVQANRTLGTNKSYAFTGCKVNSMTISMAAKDLVKISMQIEAEDELNDQTDVSLTIPTNKAFSTPNATIFFNEVEMDEVKDYSIALNNNLDLSNVVGSQTIIEQIRGAGTIEHSGTLNVTTGTGSSDSIRTNYVNDTPIEILIYIEGTDDADVTNTIKFSTLLRFNVNKLTDYNYPLQTPDRLTISMAGTTTNSTLFDHVVALVVDDDTTAY